MNSPGTSVPRCDGQVWFKVVVLALSALNLGLFWVSQSGIVLKPETEAGGAQLVPCGGSWGSSRSDFVHPKPFYPVTAFKKKIIILIINVFSWKAEYIY